MPKANKPPVRIAIVGSGKVSDYHHVPGIRLDSRAELVHQLNPTASFIWQQAQSGSTAEEIASALAEQYDVDPEIAHRDVTATLARLKELNLVTGP